MSQILLRNCRELLTMKVDKNDILGLKKGFSVLIKDDRIQKVDILENIKDELAQDCMILDCSSKVVMPGYIDSHTHLIFGKSRVDEYSLKLTKTNDEVKTILYKTGLDLSIYHTKNATDEELIKTSFTKLYRMLKNGTTTIEIKSGYGIDKETEIRTLRIINQLKKYTKQDIYATYLGAHYWDKDMGKERYIDFMIKEVMPEIKSESLASFCDVWCDEGYYTAKECEKILMAGIDNGMLPTMHTECYSDIGGAKVAAKVKAANAGHLNYLTLEDAKLMADADVVGILIPGTDFSVKHHRPFNAEILKQANMKMAIATNLNPGNWVESMSFAMQLACRNHSMTPDEAIFASTMGGAMALKIDDEYGSIEEGKYADIQILNSDDYRNCVYKLSVNEIEKVIKKGKIVIEE